MFCSSLSNGALGRGEKNIATNWISPFKFGIPKCYRVLEALAKMGFKEGDVDVESLFDAMLCKSGGLSRLRTPVHPARWLAMMGYADLDNFT